jgi:hypothetical protein
MPIGPFQNPEMDKKGEFSGSPENFFSPLSGPVFMSRMRLARRSIQSAFLFFIENACVLNFGVIAPKALCHKGFRGIGIFRAFLVWTYRRPNDFCVKAREALVLHALRRIGVGRGDRRVA